MKRNLAVMFAVAAISCSDPIQPSPAPPKDTTPPVVTSVSPTDGANDVSVTTKVVVEFSEPVDPATVNLTTFKVLNGDNLVPGSASASSSQATFTPDDSLDYLTTYTAVVSRVKDLAGNVMEGEHRWSFTTVRDSTLWTVVGEWSARPVAANESGVYVAGRSTVPGNNSSFVAALTVDGERLWLKEMSTERYCSVPVGVAVANGYIYSVRAEDPYPCLGSADIYFDVRDMKTGELVRSTLVRKGVWPQDFALRGSDAYILSIDEVIRLDVVTGEVRSVLTVKDIGGSSSTTSFNSVAIGNEAVYLAGTTCKNLAVGGPCPKSDFDFFTVSYSKDFRSRNWVSQWDDSLSLDEYHARLAVIEGVGVFLNGWSGNIIDLSKPRAAVLVAYDISSGELDWYRSSNELGSTGIATDGESIYLSDAVSESQSPRPSPMKVGLDGNIVWTASPPSRVRNMAVANGTVFGTDGTNRILRYDAATGVMKQ